MKSLVKQPLLGVSITTSSRQAIKSAVRLFLIRKKFLTESSRLLTIVTPNPEQIVMASHNEPFRIILNSADIALPDGIGVVWGLRKKSNNIERISGMDFMVDLCRIATENHARVLLYGGRGGVAGEALKKLKEQIPGLDGFAEDGAEISNRSTMYDVRDTNEEINKNRTSYFVNRTSNEKEVIKHLVQMIRSRNIEVVFIGLGAPKQEFLMQALAAYTTTHRSLSPPLVLMTVGGSFDILAGNIIRAPKVVQQLGFEWLWRLFQEPSRWQRQLALLTFVRLVLLKKIRDN